MYGTAKWHSCAKKWFRSSKVILQLYRSFENEGKCAANWHSCAKKWFRSCETPFQMVSRLRNSRSALHSCLQTTITSSFHLQIAHRLKHWTPEFLSFKKRYGMHNLSSRKCSKNVSNSSKMRCGCNIPFQLCTVVFKRP